MLKRTGKKSKIVENTGFDGWRLNRSVNVLLLPPQVFTTYSVVTRSMKVGRVGFVNIAEHNVRLRMEQME